MITSGERVLEQLRAKHPQRKADVPASLAAMGSFPRVEVELGPTLRNLPLMAGTGVSGFRNEYLRALTEPFADARAKSVIPMLNQFASSYANAELPAWFYMVLNTTQMLAPIKAQPADQHGAPDVRPIGVGECLKRAIHGSLATANKDALRDHLWPQQVAVGIADGISKLVFGMRLLVEAHPDWVVVKIDLKNAFNEIKRATVLERLCAVSGLRNLVPVIWATSCPRAPNFRRTARTSILSFRSCTLRILRDASARLHTPVSSYGSNRPCQSRGSAPGMGRG